MGVWCSPTSRAFDSPRALSLRCLRPWGVPFLTAPAALGSSFHHSHPARSSGGLPRPQDRPCPATLLPQSPTQQHPCGPSAHTPHAISPAHCAATSPGCTLCRHMAHRIQPQRGVHIGPEHAGLPSLPFLGPSPRVSGQEDSRNASPHHRLPAWPRPGLPSSTIPTCRAPLTGSRGVSSLQCPLPGLWVTHSALLKAGAGGRGPKAGGAR